MSMLPRRRFVGKHFRFKNFVGNKLNDVSCIRHIIVALNSQDPVYIGEIKICAAVRKFFVDTFNDAIGNHSSANVCFKNFYHRSALI